VRLSPLCNNYAERDGCRRTGACVSNFALRARMRKPSCLILCSQPEPEGGTIVGNGKHSSIIPSPGGGYAHATKE
jgi:hypothetical protein